MLKIFEHISTRESLKERSQEEIRRTQAKMEKKLRLALISPLQVF